MTQNCSKCKTDRPTVDFATDPTKKSGRHGTCKKCVSLGRRSDESKSKRKQYRNRPEVKAKEKEAEKQRYLGNTPVENQRRRLSSYGMGAADYDQLLAYQGGVCAGCGRKPDYLGGSKLARLCIDHDHNTGKVRGLLCFDCNLALGLMRDKLEIINNLAAYLQHTAPIERFHYQTLEKYDKARSDAIKENRLQTRRKYKKDKPLEKHTMNPNG